MPESSYKDRLLTYEVQPPQAAWDHIAHELVTNNDTINLSDRLRQFEVHPPNDAWENIINVLKKEDVTPVKTLTKNTTTKLIFYLGIAAAVMGIFAMGVMHLYNTNFLKNKAAISSVVSTNTAGKYSPNTITDLQSPSDETEAEDLSDGGTDVVIPRITRNYPLDNKTLRNTTVQSSLIPENESTIIIAAKPIRNANGEIIQNAQILHNTDSKYISITSPNGQQTKISSKFLNMLLFINNDNDIDQVDGYFDKNFLESLIWKSRFKDWRNQIINTSLVPSSNNFMDILDLKDLLLNDR